VLREPVDRVMSFFFGIKSRETGLELEYPVLVDACKALPFEEFIQLDDPQISKWIENAMCRQIAGYDDLACSPPALELAETAIKALSFFEYVGIHEDFSASLNILQYLLNWPLVDTLPAANVTAERLRPQDLAPETLDLVRKKNQADIQLYNHVLAQHQEIAARLQPLISRRRTTETLWSGSRN
jgi:hypothetical protein